MLCKFFSKLMTFFKLFKIVWDFCPDFHILKNINLLFISVLITKSFSCPDIDITFC